MPSSVGLFTIAGYASLRSSSPSYTAFVHHRKPTNSIFPHPFSSSKQNLGRVHFTTSATRSYSWRLIASERTYTSLSRVCRNEVSHHCHVCRGSGRTGGRPYLGSHSRRMGKTTEWTLGSRGPVLKSDSGAPVYPALGHIQRLGPGTTGLLYSS